MTLVNSTLLSMLPFMSTDPIVYVSLAGHTLDQKAATKQCYSTTSPVFDSTKGIGAFNKLLAERPEALWQVLVVIFVL